MTVESIEVRQRAPQPVVSVRATVPVAELTGAQGESLLALWDHLRRHDVRPAGPPFVRYHTFTETETDLETGIPVADAAVGEGRVAAGELPGGSAAVTWHIGPHDSLAKAYGRLETWLGEDDREPDGAAWEVYHWIDPTERPDPATWPDPSAWRTELVQPLK
ncbi:GyrI-like domain-containing protein [Streptosporangium minutum]|uniref:AraC effector-binding domain-containing protein n=1 Tax=Streptosporangium minutum TaxID=569862 RepID=A0A243QI27_9ACTN|nr:GyrI-like domain-containing protein [Streptosporangium minutum]OUC81616.1 hypothetical protein CA984_41790 [Streptosporangium minutum]